MIVINARIEATQETVQALKQAVLTMEAATKTESGCEDYTFSVEIGNPGAIRITERWATEAALKAHFLTQHMATFQAAMKAHPPKGMDLHCYQAEEIPLPRP
ncbi:MAG: putative quinol monooxygenase [Proteobacteria bacterium]|nr:putative quinol monooxygenase [Pseudomonadota bacterium]